MNGNKISKNETRLHPNQIVRIFSLQVFPRLDNKWNILGRRWKEKYEILGKQESYYEYLSTTAFKSLVLVLPLILTAMLLQNQLLFYFAPISIVLFFAFYIADIYAQCKKRQNLLVRDLPNLISKMIIALETGTPFETIFSQVAEQCHPLLGGMLRRLLANMEHQSIRDALQRFAREVNLPVVYDFISVVHVGMEKGYKEEISDLDTIKNDLKELRKLSLIEQTRANPAKMNLFYGLLFTHIFVFLFCLGLKFFAAMNDL